MPAAQWETIVKTATEMTQRLSVPGGWLVCRINGLHLPQSLTGWFINDIDHSWNVDIIPPSSS